VRNEKERRFKETLIERVRDLFTSKVITMVMIAFKKKNLNVKKKRKERKRRKTGKNLVPPGFEPVICG
jgi:hypothetical protein